MGYDPGYLFYQKSSESDQISQIIHACINIAFEILLLAAKKICPNIFT